MNDQELKSLWQSQTLMTRSYSLEQLQRDAAAFRRRTVRNNTGGFIAGAMVALIFGFYAWVLPVTLMRIGSGLMVLGSFVFMYQLQRRGAIRKLPPEGLALPFMTYFREELARQRDALRSVLWYIAPSFPGMSVFMWGMAQPNPADFPWQVTSVFIIPVVVVVAIHFFAAHRLQRKIDQLNQLNESAEIWNLDH
jgi:hypothetical protein